MREFRLRFFSETQSGERAEIEGWSDVLRKPSQWDGRESTAAVVSASAPDIRTLIPIQVPASAVAAVLPTGNLATSPRWNSDSPLQTAVAIKYFFSDAPPTWGETANGYTNASAQAWSVAQKATVEAVFSAYAQVAALQFVAVASQDQADISLFLSNTLTASGYAYYPRQGDVFLDVGSFPADGSNTYLAFHEIGHALGIAHAYEGGSKPTIESFGISGSRLFSVVDQRLTPKPYYLFVNGNSGGAGYVFHPSGPMLLDVAALQGFYGANATTAAGDTVYSFDLNPNFYRTIWDAGGNDTIDASNQTNPNLISLKEGSYSTIAYRDPYAGFPEWLVSWAAANESVRPKSSYNDGSNSLAIAFGAVIENAVGGSAGDVLIGNEAANLLRGLAGNDTLQGGAGNDSLEGGLGDDTLEGGDGDDVAVFTGPRSAYTVTQTASGYLVVSATEGQDTLTGIERARFADLTMALNNVAPISSSGGATVNEDTVLIASLPVASDSNGDTVTYAKATNSSHGTVTVSANGSYTYTPEANYFGPDGFTFTVSDPSGASNTYTQSLTITPVVDTFMGTSGADVLTGTAGDDVLLGLAGNDVLNVGAGNDTLDGGAGFDIARIGGGTAASINLTTGIGALGSATLSFIGIEALLGSSAADSFTGLDGPNNLPGEVFKGAGGNDTINGGNGIDRAEFSGKFSDYQITRKAGTMELTVTHKNGGADGTDSLNSIELLVFQDRVIGFGQRAEEVARVAFVLWNPTIIKAPELFAAGLSFYTNEYAYTLNDLCKVALIFRPEKTAQELVATLLVNAPGTTKTAAQLYAIMDANGGQSSQTGWAAAIEAMALDAATTQQLELMGVANGVEATLTWGGQILFGSLVGG